MAEEVRERSRSPDGPEEPQPTVERGTGSRTPDIQAQGFRVAQLEGQMSQMRTMVESIAGMLNQQQTLFQQLPILFQTQNVPFVASAVPGMNPGVPQQAPVEPQRSPAPSRIPQEVRYRRQNVLTLFSKMIRGAKTVRQWFKHRLERQGPV